jgi:hypothetical protein
VKLVFETPANQITEEEYIEKEARGVHNSSSVSGNHLPRSGHLELLRFRGPGIRRNGHSKAVECCADRQIVTIRSMANGRYLTAGNYGTEPINAKGDMIGSWETYKWIPRPNGKFTLLAAANGKYVTAGDWGCEPLKAAVDWIGGWEEFTWTIPQAYKFYHAPEDIRDGIAGRITYGAFDKDRTMMHIYDFGEVAETPVGWPVGNFTGFQVPSEVASKFQLGVPGGGYGSTSFQLYRTGAGFQIHSPSLISGPGPTVDPNDDSRNGWLGGAHLARGFEPFKEHPWADADLGRDAKLRLQYNVTIDHFDNVKGDDCIA